MLYQSAGPLRYSPGKLIVEVDPDLAAYYRSLIPKWYKVNPQRYPPHISVVRKEQPPNMDCWGKYEGEEVVFTYEPVVHMGTVYYWLNVFSTRLEQVRTELGLPVSSEYTRPPDGYVKCFHCTLGNRKEL